MVEVSRLIAPEMLVEIEADAVIGVRQGRSKQSNKRIGKRRT
jgi:hypothetical protein